MTISSFFPGHIRIRDRVLKDPDIAGAVQEFAKGQTYVTDLTINPVTGSALILYDPDAVPLDTFKHMVGELLELKRLCDFYAPKRKPKVLAQIARIGALLRTEA